MSEKNDKEPTVEVEKKKLKLTKELVENLKDEDLENVAGGDGGFRPPSPFLV
jgi:hypothetical protein